MKANEEMKMWDDYSASAPFIDVVNYDKSLKDQLDHDYSNTSIKHTIMTEFPTVYIIFDELANNKFDVYVGETNDIVQRTFQHLEDANRDDFKKFNISKTSKMFVIGHKLFNKSLTMDIENEMMLYLSSSSSIDKINNRRENPQSNYFTEKKREEIFKKTWKKLRSKDNGKYKLLFPTESEVERSAIFKSSPFHKLNPEQEISKNKILSKVEDALRNDKSHQIILVEGDAGAGKTVLLSTLFYLISKLGDEGDFPEFKNIKEYMLVNNDEQIRVYKEITKRLQMDNDAVQKPTSFINKTSSENKADICLVDEGHLLWTQGKQSYKGKNQLNDIVDRSKVTILVYDKHQMIRTQSYLQDDMFENIKKQAILEENYIPLSKQMRMDANPKTIEWIDDFIYKGELKPIPDDKGYDVKVFNDPQKMYDQIVKKNNDQRDGLSRIVATFDWDYSGASKPKSDEFWNVKFDYKNGTFEMPWNLQLKKTGKKKAWAEMPQSINEVGSTFTVQGFDLNYVGVILGPSVQYRDGKVVFDSKESKDKNATNRRTISDKEGKKDVSIPLLKNALNVLMTRGVHGLYIYATDEQLEEQLLKISRN